MNFDGLKVKIADNAPAEMRESLEACERDINRASKKNKDVAERFFS